MKRKCVIISNEPNTPRIIFNLQMDKSTIRRIYQQTRNELTPSQVKSSSVKLANNFIKNLLPKIDNFSGQKLAFYVAANNEVDPTPIIKHCQKLGNIISLPKIVDNSLVLDFKEYKIGDTLINNPIFSKLLEPQEQKYSIVPDIIFVPLIAFDKNCNRVGMGGGFYDATINYFKCNQSPQIFIGLGYDWQNCQKIDVDKWDKSLDFIVSDGDIFRFVETCKISPEYIINKINTATL